MLRLAVCDWLSTASSRPGTPGRLSAGLAAVRCAFRDQAVVVLEELHFLRILERDEDHRIAPMTTSGAARQSDHGVVMATNAHAVSAMASPVISSAIGFVVAAQ
jgi:hypothetical protein